MKTNTFSVIFITRKSKATADGKFPIYLRVTVNGVRSEVSTGLKTDPLIWNPVLGRCNGNDKASSQINSRLDHVVSKVMQVYNTMIFAGQSPTSKEVK